MSKKEIVSQIRNYLKNQSVVRAYLFGSFARGEQNKKSDIDILVELDNSQPVGLLRFIRMQTELSQRLGTNVDLVSDEALSKYVKPYIDKDKIPVYERSARR